MWPCLQSLVTDGEVQIASTAPVNKGGVIMWFGAALNGVTLPWPVSSSPNLQMCMNHPDVPNCSGNQFSDPHEANRPPMYLGYFSDFVDLALAQGYVMPQQYAAFYDHGAGTFTKYDYISVQGYENKAFVQVLDPLSPDCQVCVLPRQPIGLRLSPEHTHTHTHTSLSSQESTNASHADSGEVALMVLVCLVYLTAERCSSPLRG